MTKKQTTTTCWSVKNWVVNREQTSAVLAFEATITRNGKEVLYAQRDGDTGKLCIARTDRAPANVRDHFDAHIKRTMDALMKTSGCGWLDNEAAAWIVMTATKQTRHAVEFIKEWSKIETLETTTRPTADHYAIVVKTTKGKRLRATSQTCYPSEQIARIVAEETRSHYEAAGWNKRFAAVLVYKGAWSHEDAKPVATFKIGRKETKRYESSCTVTMKTPASVVLLNDIIQDVLKSSDANADPMHVALGRWIDRVATFDRNGGRVSMTINEWTAPMVQLLEYELRRWMREHTAKSFAKISRQFAKCANTISDALRHLPRNIRTQTNNVFIAKTRDVLGRRALRWLDAVYAAELAEKLGTTAIAKKPNFKWSDAKLAAFKEQLRREEIERNERKTRKGRRRAKRAAKRPVVVDPKVVGKKIAELIKALADSKDKGEKRKLRAQLRRLGHTGGLRSMNVEE